LAEAAGFLWRRNFTKKIIRALKGTSIETAKTRKELGVGVLERTILDSLVDKERKDEEGRTVIIRKTPDNRYYLEKLG
jgi:hypothetical protein